MLRYSVATALLVILVSPFAAWGHGLTGFARANTSYYCAPVNVVPVVYYVQPSYTPPGCLLATQSYSPATQAPPFARGAAPAPARSPSMNTAYATATAAPPSLRPTSGEPPLAVPAAKGSPAVSESRTYYDAYAISVRDPARQFGERCALEFWNLTNKDLTVTVDGRAQTLTRGKSMLLDVPRRFTWQVDDRGEHKEHVAMGEAGLEIVVRR